MALQIVLIMKSMNPPGRFLSQAPNGSELSWSCDDDQGWYEIEEMQAVKKVAQRLREKDAADSFAAQRIRRRKECFKQQSDSKLATSKSESSQNQTTLPWYSDFKGSVSDDSASECSDKVRHDVCENNSEAESQSEVTRHMGLFIPTAAALVDAFEE